MLRLRVPSGHVMVALLGLALAAQACTEEEPPAGDAAADASADVADVTRDVTADVPVDVPVDVAGDAPGGDAGDGAIACVPKGGRCSANQQCCGSLECCAGVPVPSGQEFCSDICPRAYTP